MKPELLRERLAPFRKAVLREAHARSDQLERDAQAEVAAQLAAAEQDAERLVTAEREAGQRAAENALARERMAARRQARELTLASQHEASRAVRQRAIETLERMHQGSDPAYRALVDRLARLAREQLGPESELDTDPPHGGLVARLGHRSVDYTLPALVDRAMADLGPELEGLWG
jgi:hypothetical protein